jgi:hypothetical protein
LTTGMIKGVLSMTQWTILNYLQALNVCSNAF